MSQAISQPAVVPIEIRIVGPAVELGKFTDKLIESLKDLQLVKRSKPYPADEGQSRIYLTFIKK